jgi:hypothetical protein
VVDDAKFTELNAELGALRTFDGRSHAGFSGRSRGRAAGSS